MATSSKTLKFMSATVYQQKRLAFKRIIVKTLFWQGHHAIASTWLWATRWLMILQMFLLSQPANIGPQHVPRTSPKYPIWLYRGRPSLTSRGRLNLRFKGRPWDVDSGRPQGVLRTSARCPWEYSNLDV